MSQEFHWPAAPSGVPSGPPAPEPPGLPLTHRPWSGVLVTLDALIAVLGVVVTAGGVVLLAAHASSGNGGVFAGLGLAIAIGVLLLGLGALATGIVLTVLAVKGRRAADVGRRGLLTGVAVSHLVLAGFGVVGAFTAGDPGAVIGGALLPLLYGLPAVMLLRGLRTPQLVRIP